MPKLNIMVNPGDPQLRELCDQKENKCVATSFMFDDDKDKSGFTFKEEVSIPANTKVHVSMWCNRNKNGKPYFGISLEPFEEAWTKRQAAKGSFKKPDDEVHKKPNDGLKF